MFSDDKIYLGNKEYEGESVEVYVDDGDVLIDKGNGLEILPEEEYEKLFYREVK